MATMTKAKFMAAMQALDIEIEDIDFAARGGSRSIHAYAPSGKQFAGTFTHNYALFATYDPRDLPDWAALYADLNNTGRILTECISPDCEYCNE